MSKITEYSTTCKHQFEFIRHHSFGDGVVGRCMRCKCRFTSWPDGIHYDEILAAKPMAVVAEWTRLADDRPEECASASHERPVRAEWRMEAGDVGSFYCETCRYMITRGPRFGDAKIPITTTPDN